EEWEFNDSPAMQLLRRGREEGREEAWAEADQKIGEAQRKEAEAQRKEAEARKKAEIEAQLKAEAQRKEAEARQKAETEKKASIAKMLKAGIEKSAIAEFLGISQQKLAAYIRQIRKEEKK
ncbi:MAG: hypothetical protein SF052_20460, partial [Bacteroidia bacterium]|nr:hypothetical protein [Bacteroidia bacterium]